MSNLLDERLAALRAAQQAKAESQTQRKEDLSAQLSLLENRAKAFDQLLEHLEYAAQQVEQNVDDAASKVRTAYRLSLVGLAALAAVGAMTVLIAYWAASHIREDARSTATEIRLQNAEQIAAARREGHENLEVLQSELADRRDDIERQIVEVGTDLQGLVRERDAVRSELERFATLKDQVGFDLVDYRGRPVIVAPAGLEVRGWRAPGLSNLAQFNGRMYRFMDVDD